MRGFLLVHLQGLAPLAARPDAQHSCCAVCGNLFCNTTNRPQTARARSRLHPLVPELVVNKNKTRHLPCFIFGAPSGTRTPFVAKYSGKIEINYNILWSKHCLYSVDTNFHAKTGTGGVVWRRTPRPSESLAGDAGRECGILSNDRLEGRTARAGRAFDVIQAQFAPRA